MENRHVLVLYRDLSRLGPYLAALEAAGVNATPVEAHAAASLAGFSGLVLVGGTDVDPRRYNEIRIGETEASDVERDAVEFALLEQALERDLPVLAICRGLQLVNVFHGGSLIQHLSSTVKHRQTKGDRGLPVHSVVIQPGTLLFGIAGETTWQVNSRHHQAVRELGRGLRVSAVDPEDGTVEAIERPYKRFVLGVQWHPEDQALRDSGQLNLFRSFGAAID
jgi:putative glutamine amidotransferase